MIDLRYQILPHLVFVLSQEIYSTEDLHMIKNVGTPNCFTIAKTSDLNFFRYHGVPLTELINLKAWSFDTHCLTFSLKYELFNTPVFNETPETFRMSMFICSFKLKLCRILRAKKYVIRI